MLSLQVAATPMVKLPIFHLPSSGLMDSEFVRYQPPSLIDQAFSWLRVMIQATYKVAVQPIPPQEF
jgi:hypothetical protein